MPRAPKPPSPSRSIRRSSRLNGNKDLNNLAVALQQRPKRQRRKASVGAYPCSDIPVSTPTLPTPGPSGLRRSQRITPAELVKREKALLLNEQEFKQKVGELEERMLKISRKEDQASLMLVQAAERESTAILSQLEEHFMCPLCYEVMAYPYTLNPGQCGHTFCAICILKWFFSRLHRACGGWHESVDCPMCRSLLVITPDRVPRLEITFPFVPNRTAAGVVESLVEKLVEPPLGTLIVKREDTEGIWASELKEDWNAGCGRKKEKSKEEGQGIQVNAAVSDWREGGAARAEWLKRNREGKKEMNHLLKFWSTLASQDFISLKQKLGV
ncbi:hypothetical protein BDZ94DRAFT_1264236 [Collybia nuda]|uniref:RING-type domain-containing protein n=1 Tax=Collybia nuda TaxID=64659 RepID=A0A9P5Y2N9_9AGAR|nr:hypothetical protein BDZ94DRAFT_1264236 [Collybia nuda]